MTFRALVATLLVVASTAPVHAGETLAYGRVTVEHDLSEKAYPKAIAKIVDFAATRAVGLGYDMPDAFRVHVTVDPRQAVRLSTTGDEQIRLRLKSEDQLGAPRKTGIFHVYGLCHEVGHCCQYRILEERAWMSTAACEGWAHYYGARTLDLLFEEHGEEIWPDEHDYSNRGLEKSLRRWKRAKEGIDRGAYLWHELAEILGEKGVAKLFHAIQDAGIDPFDAEAQIEALLSEHRKKQKLLDWWKRAQDVFVTALERSDFETDTLPESKLGKRAETLERDSGEPRDKISWPGDAGAAVRFEVEGKDCYLTEIRVYGQRYGIQTDESFHLWLLDDAFKPIRRYTVPYEAFAYGKPHWETFRVEPTRVPREFYVCVVFHALSNKGVFRFHDGDGSGASFTGVPGERARAFDKGDWLIRAVVREKR